MQHGKNYSKKGTIGVKKLCVGEGWGEISILEMGGGDKYNFYGGNFQVLVTDNSTY